MDKYKQIKIIKAKIALLDAEKKQLHKKLEDIEKEQVSPPNIPTGKKSNALFGFNRGVLSSINTLFHISQTPKHLGA